MYIYVCSIYCVPLLIIVEICNDLNLTLIAYFIYK